MKLCVSITGPKKNIEKSTIFLKEKLKEELKDYLSEFEL